MLSRGTPRLNFGDSMLSRYCVVLALWMAGVGGVIETPVFDPAPGIHLRPGVVLAANNLIINISTVTENATIRYTTDGTTPTDTHGTLGTSITLGPFTASSSQSYHVKAVAINTTDSTSAVFSGSYIVNWPPVSTIVFNPPTFHALIGSSNISLDTATAAASIYWNIGFQAPSSGGGSTLYNSSIQRETAGEFVLRAVATAAGYLDSIVSTQYYTIVHPQVATPHFETVAGSYSDSVYVNISCATDGAAIFYHIDSNWEAYTSPVLLNSTGSYTIRSRAQKALMTQSEESEASFTVTWPQSDTPAITASVTKLVPSDASVDVFIAAVNFTLTHSSAQAEIYYTADGLTPDSSSTLYDAAAPLQFSVAALGQTGQYTVRAIAIESRLHDSQLFSYTFELRKDTAASPQFSITPGLYLGSASVQFTCATPDVTILYSTDGSTPVTQFNTSSPIVLSAAQTYQLRAHAERSDLFDSVELTGQFEIQWRTIAYPQFSSAGGYSLSEPFVDITSDTTDASIYYRMSGGFTSSQIVYDASLDLGTLIGADSDSALREGIVLHAASNKSGWLDSAASSSAFELVSASMLAMVPSRGSLDGSTLHTATLAFVPAVYSTTAVSVTLKQSAQDKAGTVTTVSASGCGAELCKTVQLQFHFADMSGISAGSAQLQVDVGSLSFTWSDYIIHSDADAAVVSTVPSKLHLDQPQYVTVQVAHLLSDSFAVGSALPAFSAQLSLDNGAVHESLPVEVASDADNMHTFHVLCPAVSDTVNGSIAVMPTESMAGVQAVNVHVEFAVPSLYITQLTPAVGYARPGPLVIEVFGATGVTTASQFTVLFDGQSVSASVGVIAADLTSIRIATTPLVTNKSQVTVGVSFGAQQFGQVSYLIRSLDPTLLSVTPAAISSGTRQVVRVVVANWMELTACEPCDPSPVLVTFGEKGAGTVLSVSHDAGVTVIQVYTPVVEEGGFVQLSIARSVDSFAVHVQDHQSLFEFEHSSAARITSVSPGFALAAGGAVVQLKLTGMGDNSGSLEFEIDGQTTTLTVVQWGDEQTLASFIAPTFTGAVWRAELSVRRVGSTKWTKSTLGVIQGESEIQLVSASPAQLWTSGGTVTINLRNVPQSISALRADQLSLAFGSSSAVITSIHQTADTVLWVTATVPSMAEGTHQATLTCSNGCAPPFSFVFSHEFVNPAPSTVLVTPLVGVASTSILIKLLHFPLLQDSSIHFSVGNEQFSASIIGTPSTNNSVTSMTAAVPEITTTADLAEAVIFISTFNESISVNTTVHGFTYQSSARDSSVVELTAVSPTSISPMGGQLVAVKVSNLVGQFAATDMTVMFAGSAVMPSMMSLQGTLAEGVYIMEFATPGMSDTSSMPSISEEAQAAVAQVTVYPTATPSKLVSFNLTVLELDELVLVSIEPSSTLITQSVQAEIVLANLPMMVVSDTVMQYERPVVRLAGQVLDQVSFEVVPVTSQLSVGCKIVVTMPATNSSLLGTSEVTVSTLTYGTSTFFTYHLQEVPSIFLIDPVTVSQAGGQTIVIESSHLPESTDNAHLVVSVAGLSSVQEGIFGPVLYCSDVTAMPSVDGNFKVTAVTPDMSSFAPGKLALQMFWSDSPAEAIGTSAMVDLYIGGGVVEPAAEAQLISTSRSTGPTTGGTLLTVLVDHFTHDDVSPQETAAVMAELIAGDLQEIGVHNVHVIESARASSGEQVSITVLLPTHNASEATIRLSLRSKPSVTLTVPYTFIEPSECTKCGIVAHSQPSAGPLVGGTLVRVKLLSLTGDGPDQTLSAAYSSVRLATGWQMVSSEERNDFTWLTLKSPDLWHWGDRVADQPHDVALSHRHLDVSTGSIFTFTPLLKPSVQAISPAAGTLAGGSTVAITLQNVASAWTVTENQIVVKFGMQQASLVAGSLQVAGNGVVFAVISPMSDESCSFDAINRQICVRTSGAHVVEVTVDAYVAYTSFSFERIAGNAIVTLDKDSSSTTGGDTLSLIVTNFAPVTSIADIKVVFGIILAHDRQEATVTELHSYSSFTLVRLQIPAHIAGTYECQMFHTAHPSENSAPFEFTFIEPAYYVSYVMPPLSRNDTTVAAFLQHYQAVEPFLVSLEAADGSLNDLLLTLNSKTQYPQGVYFTFDMPKLGLDSMDLTATVKDNHVARATFSLRYYGTNASEAYVRVVKPTQVQLCGGTLVTLVLDDFPYASINTARALVQFATENVYLESAEVSSARVATVQFLSPAAVSDANVSAVLTMMGSSYNFELGFVEQKTPEVLYLSHSHVSKYGGTVLSAKLRAFKPLSNVEDMLVVYSSTTKSDGVTSVLELSTKPLSFSYDAATDFLNIAVSIKAAAPGALSVSFLHKLCPASRAYAELTVVDMDLPGVSVTPYYAGAIGSTEGSDYLSVSLRNFPPTSSREDIEVAFDGVSGSVHHLHSWSPQDTQLTLLTPPWSVTTQQSAVTVTIAHTQHSSSGASLAFTYMPQAFTYIRRTSVSRGPSIGGTATTITIANLPLVSSTSDLVVWFGENAGTVLQLVSSTYAETTVIVRAPAHTEASCTVSVTANGDSSSVASIPWVYSMQGSPEVTTISASKVAAGVSGKSVRLVLSGLSSTTTLTASDLSGRIGTQAVTVTRIAYATPELAVVDLEIPVIAEAVRADIRLFVKEEGPNKAATVSFKSYDPTMPRLVYAAPVAGSMSGGTVVSIQFDEYDSFHDTTGYTVTFNSSAALVQSATWNNVTQTTSLIVEAPVSSQEGDATVTVTPSGSGGNAFSFTFQYVASSAPTVVTVYPSSGPISGGTLVQLRMSNVAGTLNAAEDIQVSFGSVSARVVSLDCSNIPMSACHVTVISPQYQGFGNVNIKLVPNGLLAQAATTVFHYFQPCNHRKFCWEKQLGKVLNSVLWNYNPPTSETCDPLYCMPASSAILNQYISQIQPSRLPQSGNKRVVIKLHGFETSRLGSFSVLLHDGASVASDIQVTSLEPGVQLVTAVLPASRVAGNTTLTVVAFEVEEQKMIQAKYPYTYDVETSEEVTLTSAKPTSGTVGITEQTVLLELSNVPLETTAQDVSILFNETTASVTQLVMHRSSDTPASAHVVVAVPAGLATGVYSVSIVIQRAAQGGSYGVGSTVGLMDAATEYNLLPLASSSKLRVFSALPSNDSYAFQYTVRDATLQLDNAYPVRGVVSASNAITVELTDIATGASDVSASVWQSSVEVPLVASPITHRSVSTGFTVLNIPSTHGLAVGEAEIVVSDGNSSITFDFSFVSSVPRVYRVFPDSVIVTVPTEIKIWVENWVPPGSTQQHRYTLCGDVNRRYPVWTFDEDSNVVVTVTTSGCTVEASPVFSMEHFNPTTRSWDELWRTEVSQLTSLPPLPVVAPYKGTNRGHQTISISTWFSGITHANTVAISNLQVTMAGQQVDVTTLVSSLANGWTTFKIESPPYTQGAAVLDCSVQLLNSSYLPPQTTVNSATFQFEYLKSPEVKSASPSSGDLAGGAEISVSLTSFEVTHFASELTVTFGGVLSPRVTVLHSNKQQRTMEIVVTTPAYSASQVVPLNIYNTKFPSAGTASLLFEYRPMEAILVHTAPDSGSVQGGTVVKLTVKNADLSLAPDASDWQVTFGSMHGTVDSITHSNSNSVLFMVTVPAAEGGKAGLVTLELQSGATYQTIIGQFVYTGPLELLSVPSVGSIDGGTSIELIIQNYPYTNTLRDIVCMFGPTPAVVEAFAWTEEQTNITVQSPRYAGSVQDTQIAVHVTVFNPAMPSLVAVTSHRYHRSIEVTSASFTASFSHVKLVLSQKANLANVQTALAGFVSTSGSSAFCVSDSGMQYSVDLSGCPSSASQTSVAPAYGMGHEAIYVSVSHQLLKNSLAILPQGDLSLGSSMLHSLDGVTTLKPQVLIVELPVAPSRPVAQLMAPAAVGCCDSIWLDGSMSTGIAPLAFHWSCDNNVALNDILTGTTSSRLHIKSAQLDQTDFDYQIRLTVYDARGQQSDQLERNMTKAALPMPTIGVHGPQQRHASVHKDLLLVGYGNTSGCATQSSLMYTWTKVVGPASSHTQYGPALKIHAGSMQAGSIYHWELAVYSSVDPTKFATARVTVTTELTDLVATLAGADTRQANNTYQLEFDASGSFDPAEQDPVLCEGASVCLWECTQMSLGTPCHHVSTGAKISMGSTSTATVAAGSLGAGLYTFTFSLAGSTNRLSRAAQQVQITEASILQLDLRPTSSITYDTSPAEADGVPYSLRMGTHQKLSLMAGLVYDVARPADVAWEWSESIHNLDLAALRGHSDSRTLVIPESSLSGPQVYNFTVKATQGDSSGTASMVVYVGVGPSGGSCVVNPPVGNVLHTAFDFRCEGWIQEDEPLLSYSFHVQTVAGSWRVVRAPEEVNSADFVLGEAGSIQVQARVYNSRGEYTSFDTGITVTNSLLANTTSDISTVMDNSLARAIHSSQAGYALNILAGIGSVLQISSCTSTTCADPYNAVAAQTLLLTRFETVMSSMVVSNHLVTAQLAESLLMLTQSCHGLADAAINKAMQLMLSVAQTAQPPNQAYMTTSTASTLLTISQSILRAIGSDRSSTTHTSTAAHLSGLYHRVTKSFLYQTVPGEVPGRLLSQTAGPYATDLSQDTASAHFLVLRAARSRLLDPFVTPSDGAGAATFNVTGASFSQLLSNVSSTPFSQQMDGGISSAVDLFISANAETLPATYLDDHSAWSLLPLKVLSRSYGLRLSNAFEDAALVVSGLSGVQRPTVNVSANSSTGEAECRSWDTSASRFSLSNAEVVSVGTSSVQCVATALNDFFIVTEGPILCPSNCSSRGTCNHATGVCDCDFTWHGDDCNTVRDCPFSQGSLPCTSALCNWTSSLHTTVNSTCNSSIVQPFCESSGWTTVGCPDFITYCPSNCSTNGFCNFTTGSCLCSGDYFDLACSQKYCPANCSTRGSCDHNTGVCTCTQGYTGSDCGALVSASVEQASISLLAAPSDICAQDQFRATVVVEQTPGGMPSLMSYCVRHANQSCVGNMAMSYKTTTFDFETPDTLPVGNYTFWLFAQDPLLRIDDYDTEFLHHFEVHSEVVVPVYMEGTALTTKGDGAIFEASIAESACVNSTFVSVWSWALTDDGTSADLLSTLPSVLKNEANLVVPAGALEPGHTYTATVNVYFAGMPSSASTVSSPLTVSYAPISVQINTGSTFALGRPDDVSFTAVVADPDGGHSTSLTYSWSIYKKNPPIALNLGALGSASSTSAVLQLLGGSLLAGELYDIVVTVSRANVADAIATTVVTVYADSMPQPNVGNVPSPVFNAEAVLSLFGTTTGAIAANFWAWSVVPYIDLDAWSDGSTGTNASTQDLALRANALADSTTYQFTLQVRAVANGPSGTITVTVVTNTAPSGGTFEVSPSSAESLSTNVAFSASNWVDVHGPIEYKFGYYLPGVDSKQLTLRDWSQLPTFDTSSLPLGQVRPVLWIRDQYGKATKVRLGCTGDFNCANVRDINVYAAALQGSNHASDMAVKLNGYVAANHPASDTILFLRAVMDVVNLDSVEDAECNAVCQTAQTDVRHSVLQLMINAATAAPPAVTVEALARTVDKPTTLDSAAVNQTDAVLDTILALFNSDSSGLPAASSAQILDIFESKLQSEGANNLTSASTDAKIHTQMNDMTSATLVSLGANDALTLVSKAQEIEVALRKASPHALQRSGVSTSTSTITMPADTSFLSNLAGYSAGDVFSLQAITYTPAVNPLNYVDSTTTRSGLTSILIRNGSGSVVTVSGLESTNAIEVTTSTGAPVCAYYNGSAYASDGMSTIGLSSQVVRPTRGQYLDCKTRHLTDFAIIETCDPKTDCSGHGLCKQDSTCQCVCGYYGTNCADVHLANWTNPVLNRTFSGAENQLLDIGNDGANGTVALVPYDGLGHTCGGAGIAPYGAFSAGVGVRMVVNSFGQAVLPHLTPLTEGYYTLCYCNAEKQKDPVYSHCGEDCAFHHRSEVIQIIPRPRLGPIADPGTVRVVTGVSSSVRILAGNTSEFAVRTDDMLFVSSSCSSGAAASGNSSLHLPLHIPAAHDNASASLFITTPDTLVSDGAVELQVCFATKEAAASSSDEWLQYTSITTLTVIVLPLFNGGNLARMITGTAPDFVIEAGVGAGAAGIDGGDRIYFMDSCTGLQATDTVNHTSPFSTIQYGNDAIGPDCDSMVAVTGYEPVYSASSQMDECGGQVGLGYAGIDRDRGWCSTRVGVAATSVDADLFSLLDLSNQPTTAHWVQMSAPSEIVLGGVRSQGRADDDMWVTEYSVAYSLDGSTWTNYRVDDQLHIFDANWDRDSVAENFLVGSPHAVHVRVFPKSWYRGIGMRVALMACPSDVTIQMPSAPYMTSSSVDLARELKLCFAPRRTEGDTNGEYAELASSLAIVPEPWQPAIYHIEDQGQVVSILFDAPGESASARQGDFVYLHQDASKCSSILSSYEVLSSHGPSSRMRVSAVGKIERETVMAGRVNELREGTYAVCYATYQSRGDSPSDFTALSTQLLLQRVVMHPTLVVPLQVAMGQELVVRWEAPSGGVSKQLDWIGLFEFGACRQNDDLTAGNWVSTSGDADAPQTQNRCYKKWAAVVPRLESGEVRFSTALLSGKLEARYFAGDSIDGQGQVCQRLDGSEGGLSVYCALEAVAESRAVLVGMGIADGVFEYEDDRDKIAGLQMACSMGTCVTGEVPERVAPLEGPH